MKRKVGTEIEEDLLRRAKVLAAAEGLPLRKVLEAALLEYLDRRSWTRRRGAVAGTRAVIPADAAQVEAIMEEEGVLDA